MDVTWDRRIFTLLRRVIWPGASVLSASRRIPLNKHNRRNKMAPKGRAGPSHCIARVNVETGKVEYLEVPVTVVRKPGEPDRKVYGIAVKSSPVNTKGIDVAAEERSRTDGWEIPAFWGSPVASPDG